MTIARRAVLMLTCAAAFAVLAPARVAAQTAPAPASTPSVAPSVAGQAPTAALQAWVEAFNSRDPKRIVARYAPNAVFWGTTAKTIAITPEQLWDYFKDAGQRPATKVTIDSTYQRLFGETMAVVSGAYTFADVRGGVSSNIRPARYTLVFQRVGDAWLIIDHHSSRVPEP